MPVHLQQGGARKDDANAIRRQDAHQIANESNGILEKHDNNAREAQDDGLTMPQHSPEHNETRCLIDGRWVSTCMSTHPYTFLPYHIKCLHQQLTFPLEPFSEQVGGGIEEQRQCHQLLRAEAKDCNGTQEHV